MARRRERSFWNGALPDCTRPALWPDYFTHSPEQPNHWIATVERQTAALDPLAHNLDTITASAVKVRGNVALLEGVDAATPNDVVDDSVRQNMILVIPLEHPLAKINQWDTGVTYRSDRTFLFLFVLWA